MDVEKIRFLTPRSFGGDSGGDWESIAMGLARCSRAASDYGRAKFALEWTMDLNVARNLATVVLDPRAQWKGNNHKTLVKLCMMVADETLSAGRCRNCNGTGELWHNAKVLLCQRCGGIGVLSRVDVNQNRNNFWGSFEWREYKVVIELMEERIAGWDEELRRA